jgi:hypothetical protein
MQWLYDSSQIDVVNLNNVRCDTSKHFKNKGREYLAKLMCFKQAV